MIKLSKIRNYLVSDILRAEVLLRDNFIKIYIDKGEIPYMIIQTQKSLVQLKLSTNEYFRKNDDIMNTLSKKEQLELNKYLRSLVPGDTLTIYQSLLCTWNGDNPSHIVDINTPQPDYTTIKEPK